MSTTHGNDAWRALRDDVNSKGEPLIPFEPSEFDDVWELLTSALQLRVARGELTIEEALEIATGPEELCPMCSCRPISTNHRVTGICDSCRLRLARDRHLERLSELDALRESNAAKTAVRRAREPLGLNPRKGRKGIEEVSSAPAVERSDVRPSDR